MSEIDRTREIQLLREIILGADASITEGFKWNAPSFAAPQDFATLHLRAKDSIQVVLHLGVKVRRDAAVRESVDDPAALLAWRSADRAIVTFRDAADIEAKRAPFSNIVRQWVRFLREAA